MKSGPAMELFQAVERDPAAPVYMKLDAEHQAANLYELEGNRVQAGRMYEVALATFESSWAQVREETSRLPFLANAEAIYDDYIDFLIGEGKAKTRCWLRIEAARGPLLKDWGSQERARVLSFAERSGAEKRRHFLFYWLGERQSWLWACGPLKAGFLAGVPGSTQVICAS